MHQFEKGLMKKKENERRRKKGHGICLDTDTPLGETALRCEAVHMEVQLRGLA